MRVPTPGQLIGAKFLSARPAAYLADYMGEGKSYQAVLAADLSQARQVLVVCLAVAEKNWINEFKHGATARVPVQVNRASGPLPDGPTLAVVSYQRAIDKEVHARLRARLWDAIIIDEAHRLGDPFSKWTRALLGRVGLIHSALQVWYLSGTPSTRHIGQQYPVYAASWPKATFGLGYDDWMQEHCIVEDSDYGPKIKGNKPGAEEKIKKALDGFMLRRLPKEGDLPPLSTEVWQVPVQDMLAEAGQSMEPHELEAVRYLIDDTVDPDTISDEALEAVEDYQTAVLRRLFGIAKAPYIAARIAEELDAGMDKVVLICWHRSVMDILEDALKPYGVARIDGRTKDKQKEVDRFQNPEYYTTCRVFIGQMVSAGASITLTAACEAVIVEPHSVPGDNLQAVKRVHRKTQTRPVRVRFAAAAGTVDVPFMKLAEKRMAELAAALPDEPI